MEKVCHTRKFMQTNNACAYAILTNQVELNFATSPSRKLTIEIKTPFFSQIGDNRITDSFKRNKPQHDKSRSTSQVFFVPTKIGPKNDSVRALKSTQKK